MKTVRFFAMFLLAGILASFQCFAAEESKGNSSVTANVGLFSEYAFRGITQSDESIALQGGADYSTDIMQGASLYLGTWGSTVDFNDGDEASVEIDLYGGVSFPIDRMTLSVGLVYYAYPGADSSLDYDFIELQMKSLYDFGVAAVDASLNYSPDYFASSGDSLYVQANAAVPLPQDFSVKGHIGYQTIDDNAAFAFPDYMDWSLGVGYSFKGFDTSLSYTDTDMSHGDCADGCESRGILSISRTF